MSPNKKVCFLQLFYPIPFNPLYWAQNNYPPFLGHPENWWRLFVTKNINHFYFQHHHFLSQCPGIDWCWSWSFTNSLDWRKVINACWKGKLRKASLLSILTKVPSSRLNIWPSKSDLSFIHYTFSEALTIKMKGGLRLFISSLHIKIFLYIFKFL